MDFRFCFIFRVGISETETHIAAYNSTVSISEMLFFTELQMFQQKVDGIIPLILDCCKKKSCEHMTLTDSAE